MQTPPWPLRGSQMIRIYAEKLPGAGEEIQATLVFLQQTLDCVIQTFSLPELFALGELLL